MTHTPGPWQVEQMPFGGPPGWEVSSCEDTYSQDELFVTVWGSGECTEADAHLIAAAPEMLEVLEDLVDILEKAARSEMDDEGMVLVSYGAVYFALSKAHDVIRKARGEA